MSWWEAILLGIVEGLTEYLPVSSTGHLLLVQRLLGIPPDRAANAYAIAIQAGAIVAVLGLYRQRVAQMARGLVGKDSTGGRLLLALALAFVPAAAAGLLFEDTIESALFGLRPVATAWIVGGLAILWLAHRGVLTPRHTGLPLDTLDWRRALLIGLAQCLALWPGMSRSLVTIAGGVLAGLTLPAAVEFSFLLGVVTLGAATVYKAIAGGEAMVGSYGVPVLTVGFLAAIVSAAIAVRWMVGYLQRHDMALFGWYRIGIGLLTLALLAAGTV
ncbi:MAG: undecaprenyl-diphosphate phosphatase [Thermoanaerobaculia bacterium]